MKRLELDHFLPYRLNVTAAVLNVLFEERVLAPEQISFPQWRILAILGSEGPSPQQAFVKRTNMDKISISRAVSALIDLDAIESTVAPGDKRARLLSLSENGRKLFKSLSGEASELEIQISQLSGLPDVNRLIGELDRIEAAIRTIKRSGKPK